MPPTAPNEENAPTLDYLAPTLDSPRRSTSADSSSVPASPLTASDGPATAPYHRTVLPPPGPGALFGTYELIEKLGQGGMGIVYRARDLKLSREVALKVIRDGGFAEARQVERFYQEARAAAGLDHPNILPIFEIDQFGGLHFFTMKLAPAGSLHKNFKNYVGNARRSAELIEKVARAVHEAHAHGILHRDLKPGNILLEEEDSSEPLVADFGLAKILGTEAVLTETGAPLGTPAYMAPEQAAGPSAQLTPASDVWSLGVILYELLTGERPFQGNSSDEILSRIESSEPTPPRKLRPKLDRDLETICLKCLEKEPGQRYATANDLAEDLHRWLADEPIAARRAGFVLRIWRGARRRRFLLITTSVLLATAVATTAVNYYTSDYRVVGEHRARLERGEEVTLVPDRGPPRYSRWRWSQGEPGIHHADHAFTIRSHGDSLLELLPDVPCRAYRIVAELRHDEGPDAAEAGIYFFHQSQKLTQTNHCFFAVVAFADQGKKTGFKPPGSDPRLYYGQVALTLRRLSEPGPLLKRQSGTPVYRFYPAGRNLPGRQRPWRRLVIDVAPESISVAWGDEQVGRIDHDAIVSRCRPLVADNPELPAEALFHARGGLGLYVFNSVVSVRSVSILPHE